MPQKRNGEIDYGIGQHTVQGQLLRWNEKCKPPPLEEPFYKRHLPATQPALQWS
jgi:hypothetical protein